MILFNLRVVQRIFEHEPLKINISIALFECQGTNNKK